MKKKIAILVCIALVVSAASFIVYRTYRNFVTPNFLNANIEALTNTEADVTLVDCYKDKSIEEDSSSATSYTICPDGTTDYKVGKCTEKRGNRKFLAGVAGKCIK